MTQLRLPRSYTMEHIVLAAGAVLIVALLIGFVINLRFKINYARRWKELQRLLGSKDTWNEALIAADKMLDQVLKKRRFKGKTMGERLVAAQHDLSANDMVWYSHKLTNKVINEGLKPTKAQVKKCLLGFWRALKDLGAFTGKEDAEQ